MPELSPIPSAQRPSDPGYQPVSGYAVAAAIVTAIFVVALVVVAYYAVATRRAVLSWEWLVLPVAGVILAAIGRSHIRNSEGTRGGLPLTTRSWWVCVLGGAGFAAYLFANVYVIERRSAQAAEAFFQDLAAGKPRHAFYDYMLPPEDRNRASPDAPEAFDLAYGQAGYTAFRNSELVRLCLRNTSAFQVERTGTKDVVQEGDGFRVTHLFRLRCPEGVFDVVVKMFAAEAKRGGPPAWRIPATPSPGFSVKMDQVSQYGRLVDELQHEGEGVAQQWINMVGSRRAAAAYLLTTPEAHRKKFDESMSLLSTMAGGPVAVFPLGPQFLTPDRVGRGGKGDPEDLAFDELLDAGIFRRDNTGTPLEEEKAALLRKLWRSPEFVSQAPRAVGATGPVPVDATVIAFRPDRITVVIGIDLAVKAQMVMTPCAVAVECTDPEVLAAVTAARERGAAAKDDGSVTLRNLPSRGWRVVWFRTDMEMVNPNPAARAPR